MAIIKTQQTSLSIEQNNHIFKALKALGVLILFLGLLYILRIKSLFVLLIFPIMYLAYQLNKAYIFRCGIIGEKKVLKKLSKLSDEYIIYNDLFIYNGESSAQIDHLVLSPYGIFCIETKNMKGLITGKEEDTNWLQKKVGRRGRPYTKKFYNPCKQSKGHSYKLKMMLSEYDIENIWVEPVVVFSRIWTCRLKTKTVTPVLKVNKLLNYFGTYSNIIYDGQLISYIENIIDNNIESRA